MRLKALPKALAFSAGVSVALAAPALNAAQNKLIAQASRVIYKDVAIIGGGASGAYAAVRLREDLGKSVVVVEKAARMGGHVSSYTDPSSGTTYDFGVQSFNDIGPAAAFFAKLGIPTGAMARNALNNSYADFSTGQIVKGYIPPAAADRTAAMTRYLDVAAKYESLITPGYFNFPKTPEDIPADLLSNFGELAVKYNFTDALPQIFSVTGLGVGDITKQMALWVMQAFSATMARSFVGQASFFVPASKRNQDVYDKIASLLGEDVLLNTTVTTAERSESSVVLLTTGSDGSQSAIVASRLLIAIEPTHANMKPFALDTKESDVFDKFRYSNIYAGIVSHPSLPVGGSISNTAATAAPANYAAQFPSGNFVVRFDNLGGRLFRVLLVGGEEFSSCNAQALTRKTVDRLIAAGTLPTTTPVSELEIVAWADHGAMHARVSESELKNGFIQAQYALQGRHSTYFTGATFSAQFQAVVWQFTDLILPDLVKGI